MLQQNRISSLPSTGDAVDDEIDILALAGTLWRGKWILLLFALLAGLAGGYYAFAVATPRYTASTSLALELRSEPIVDIEALVGGRRRKTPR